MWRRHGSGRAEHRLDGDEAVETAVDLAYNLPKLSYKRRDVLVDTTV